jgi:hypothetical protein
VASFAQLFDRDADDLLFPFGAGNALGSGLVHTPTLALRMTGR